MTIPRGKSGVRVRLERKAGIPSETTVMLTDTGMESKTEKTVRIETTGITRRTGIIGRNVKMMTIERTVSRAEGKTTDAAVHVRSGRKTRDPGVDNGCQKRMG